MIIFGRSELGGGKNGRMDYATHAGCHPGLAFLGQTLLVVIVEKDNIHILPGPGWLARMVAGPKDLQKLPIRYDCWIIIHLHRLGVIPEASVSGMFLSAPRITHPGAHYPFEDPEPGLHSPKSPEAEGEGFHPGRLKGIQGRNVAHLGCCGLLHDILSFLERSLIAVG